MATLVLSAVGTAIGGPIGGAIGALIGQQVDSAVFAPKPRHGPRLNELSLQTSSYGTAIPKIFGTMRVAGTVIWSTDLQEHRSTDGGGKGQPDTVSYSYSASFAVALSERPVKAVRRIWADGKLLRGAAGDFKSRVKFRLYGGGEDQVVDPLIASAEGAGQTPAFRGVAYAMFEDLALADYGNRIPSVTFEVVAEDAPVAIGGIAEELSEGMVADGGTPLVVGYAAGGDSVRGALEGLTHVVPLSLVEDAGQLKIQTSGGPFLQLQDSECGARTGQSGGRSEVLRRASASIPQEVSIAYHDVARDYQTGMQRATFGLPGLRSDRQALPAVLTADEAKALAEYRLQSLWAARATAKVQLGWRKSTIRPGALVRVEGQPGLWKVARWTLEGMVAKLELAGVAASGPPSATGTPGRPIGHSDEPVGATVLRLFDLPLPESGIASQPRLFVLAAGTEAGWRRADLALSYDGGETWAPVGATAAPAVIGTTVSALPAGGAALFDVAGTVEVELFNDRMWLENRDDAALVAGANLAVIGNELVQFGRAESLGQRRFRLSRLLRGRRGTEWAGDHAAGEAFALIEPSAVKTLNVPAEMLGGAARLLANGLGDGPEGVRVACAIEGLSARPPSPVHLRADMQPNGDMMISWVRRSRAGWAWLSGSDTALGEESEAYLLTISGTSFERSLMLAEPYYLYSLSEQAADGMSGPATIMVVQVGSVAASRPATIQFVQ